MISVKMITAPQKFTARPADKGIDFVHFKQKGNIHSINIVRVCPYSSLQLLAMLPVHDQRICVKFGVDTNQSG